MRQAMESAILAMHLSSTAEKHDMVERVGAAECVRAM
jgi:hypothetical protein